MRKSINRTTVIIVLAVFLSISVGYALFSDTITIEGTATAQGNFDITATCQTGYSEDWINLEELESEDEGQSGYINDICTVSNDTITASVELKQPGSARTFTMNIKNTGSIDAYLKLDSDLWGPAVFDENFITTELTNISTGEVTNKSYNSIKYDKDYDPDNNGFYIKQFPTLDYMSFIIRLKNGIYTDSFFDISTGEELDESLIYVDTNGKYYLKLSPDDTLIGMAYISWDERATEQGYSVKTTFTVPFDFVQKTNDMELDPEAEAGLYD